MLQLNSYAIYFNVKNYTGKIFSRNQKLVNRNYAVNRISANSEIGRAKFGIDYLVKLSKLKLLIELSSRIGFLILAAR